MAIFGGSQQTAQITASNVRLQVDQWAASAPGVTNNNMKNPLGLVYYDVGGNAGTPTSSPGLYVGAPAVYKYVLYKSTANPALQSAPAVVYYTDETFTTVSGQASEGFTGTTIDCAGFLMPNTTDTLISGAALTAAYLNNGGLGSGVWIAVGGVVKSAYLGVAATKGDFLFASTAGAFTMVDLSNHGAQTADKIVAYALTTSAANKADVIVQIINVA